MSVLEPIDLSQPKNDLSTIAEMERKKLLPKNNFNDKNQYSSVNKDALSDGDSQGKGTGSFLDTTNGGAIQDIIERKEEIKINEYQPNKPYTKPVN
jgi:hypothetical protein